MLAAARLQQTPTEQQNTNPQSHTHNMGLHSTLTHGAPNNALKDAYVYMPAAARLQQRTLQCMCHHTCSREKHTYSALFKQCLVQFQTVECAMAPMQSPDRLTPNPQPIQTHLRLLNSCQDG
jgi:hypothetical protein